MGQLTNVRHKLNWSTNKITKETQMCWSIFWNLKKKTNLQVGRQQQHELGEYIRKRYSNLIENKYHRNKIYVQSTDVDRTLMSAAHNLAGMFPPQNNQIWSDSLLWQAIPIHTVSSDNDYVLGMSGECVKLFLLSLSNCSSINWFSTGKMTCPLYDKIYEEYEKSDEIQSMLKKHRPLIEYLELHTGTKIVNVRQIRAIYSPLLVEQLKNFTWALNIWSYPGWLCKQIQRFIWEIKNIPLYYSHILDFHHGPKKYSTQVLKWKN